MKQPWQSRTRIQAFHYALSGFLHVLKTQRNAWIHAMTTIATIIMALWLRLVLQDIAILLLAIGMVWMAEFINTALEAVVNLASPNIHPLARVGKDVGAAAVLIAAGVAALVGLLIMGPPLWERLYGSAIFP